MWNLVIGMIFEVLIIGFLINFTILGCCVRKKKPVEELMAHPKFNAPPTANNLQQSAEPKKPVNTNKPNVEHTISIKLDNNADEDDLQGPRESMSRDPMIDAPSMKTKPSAVVTGRGGNAAVNEYNTDKETSTPPSNLLFNPNKSSKPAAAASAAAPPPAKSLKPGTPKDPSQTRKKRQRTLDEKNEDATQEFKPSKDEPPSNKLDGASTKSARKRKTKSTPKPGKEKNKSTKIKKSIKTQGRFAGRTAQTPSKPSTSRDDTTKEIDATQNEDLK